MLSSRDCQNRFVVKKMLGQGSFSTIYSAFDNQRKETVALKVEKVDKPKKILKFEYQVLERLQGLPHICPVYEFVESEQPQGLNFIVMKMLGKNLATLKRQAGKDFTPTAAIKLLVQMLDAIEKLHDRGYIHRDIKPSNFVMGKGKTRKQVFMVDFGLCKLHLDCYGRPLEQRPNTDFRGTITYASLNAHNKIDLSRRDDLWSLYFVLLDFMNETLPWRNCKDNNANDVRDSKTKCLAEPDKYLWKTTTSGIIEDRPNYGYIREQLLSMLQKEEVKEHSVRSIDTKTSSAGGKRKKTPSVELLEEPPRKEPQRWGDFPNQHPVFHLQNFPVPLRAPPEENKQAVMKEFFKVDIDRGYYEKIYGGATKQML